MRPIKKEQLDFLNWEMGLFIHFGIRTFYEGHKDWDGKEMPASGFNPKNLDCEQWVTTAKKAGMQYAILVCKHHDGFANWPSEYTEYSVKNSPWKDGKGDVVREFVAACRKHDLKVGLYYSPAQAGYEGSDNKDYDDYFINQISELLQNYGKIDYLWFDGCGSEGHEYDTVRIVNAIRTMQPNILIFNMWDPDTRWVGNEAGYVPLPNCNIVSELEFSVRTDKADSIETLFLPGECDCMMRNIWFYSDCNEDQIKSLDQLMGMYYCSVGYGANLLLNIAPDRDGLLPKADVNRLMEFADKIKKDFSSPLKATCTREENTYTLAFDEPTLVNHVVLMEDLSEGDKIEAFSVFATSSPWSRKPIQMYQGNTVGHKRICKFPSIMAKQVEIVIEKERLPHKLSDLKVFYVEG